MTSSPVSAPWRAQPPDRPMVDPAHVLAGQRRALARALSEVENATPEADALLSALFPHTGRAHLVGITGSPGAGKSSLVNELAKALSRAGQTVGIVAVDPTSPFTGGAILGDRIRMRDLAGDPGIFIRSMASRGSLGGLAATTQDMTRVLDAAGFDRVLIETVGAGQSEVEIARLAHTTLVVEAPGLGDEVQGIKAGILEIADILILNKADQPGAETALRALRASLELAPPPSTHHAHDLTAPPQPARASQGWTTPLLQTVATTGAGLPELLAALDAHHTHLRTTDLGARQQKDRLRHELLSRLRHTLLQRHLDTIGTATFEALVERVLARDLTPAQAVRNLMESL